MFIARLISYIMKCFVMVSILNKIEIVSFLLSYFEGDGRRKEKLHKSLLGL